ncbi:MAG: hypothetical protein Q4D93_03260 [Porphyromonas sp.]|nr:hypothetical protein [Porphyromonas sp.]
MIDYLKTIFAIGDYITISTCEGKIDGYVEAFGGDFLVLKSHEGDIVGIKEDLIVSFSKQAERTTATEEVAVTPTVEEPKVTPVFKQFKPGDKIPLEELKQRDPELGRSWRIQQKRNEYRQAQIDATESAVKEALESGSEELKQKLEPMGAIVELTPSFQFAFIDDIETGDRRYFNRADIVDPALYEASGEQIEVVYERTANHKGPASRSIFYPGTVEDILHVVERQLERKDLFRIQRLLEVAHEVLPDNKLVEQVLAATRQGRADHRNDWQSGNGYQPHDRSGQQDSLYREARTHLTRREYGEALEYYQKAIAIGERVVNSIKESTQAYISMHAQEQDEEKRKELREKGLHFIEEHRADLPDDMSTLFTLENVYFALGDYSKHREIVDRIISDSEEHEDWARYVFYQNKSAQSFMRIGDLASAAVAVAKGLEVEANNPHLLRTQHSIEQAGVEPQQEESDEGTADEASDPFSKYY